jgi:hypothetical protein
VSKSFTAGRSGPHHNLHAYEYTVFGTCDELVPGFFNLIHSLHVIRNRYDADGWTSAARSLEEGLEETLTVASAGCGRGAASEIDNDQPYRIVFVDGAAAGTKRKAC